MLARRFASACKLSSLHICGHTRRCPGATPRAMATTTDIAVSFKTALAEEEFERTFKLVDDSDVRLTINKYHVADPSDGPSSSSNSSFDALAFFKHLNSTSMGYTLMTTPSIPSTQAFMRSHASVLPEGTVLVADQQTRGKGRGGNVWTSPDGCLMFTALRRLQVPGPQAAFINYVVCLAVVQGIKDATKHLIQGGLDVQIKWPNDIYYAGVKIGGALIHTSWNTGRFCVLTGIGLNVSNTQPTTCLNDIIFSRMSQQQQSNAAGLAAKEGAVDCRICKEQLLACVLNHLEACFATFEAQGFEPLKPMYLSSWMHSNQQVELDEDVAAGSGTGVGLLDRGKKVTLTIVGLSPYGFLLAVDALGQQYELTPDGNSLDMMQGLIKNKLS